jgi:capsular polysaccharide biosynthesis protein
MTTLRTSVAKLHSLKCTIWEHRLLVISVFAILSILSIYVASKIPKQYVAGANLLVTNGNTRDDPTLQSPDLPSIATSTVVLSRAQKALDLDLTIITLKHRLVAKPPAFKSSILSLMFTDADPERAVLVVNGIADQMAKYFAEVSTARFDSDLHALDVELDKQRGLILSINAKIRAHGDPSVAVLDDRGADTISDRVAALESETALSQAVLSGDRAHLGAFDAGIKGRSSVEKSEILQNDHTYKELQTAVAIASSQYETAKATYTANFPGLSELKTKADRLKQSLDTEKRNALTSPDAFSPAALGFDTERRNALATEQADSAKATDLSNLLRVQRDRLSALPSLEFLRLQRTAAQADYLSISARRATSLANRADALSLGSVVVVDRAITAEAVTGFSGLKLMALVVLVALALGIASAFVAEALDPRLRRPTQIEDLYGISVVGSLGQSR